MQEDYTQRKLVIGIDKDDISRILKGEILECHKSVIKLVDNKE